MRWKIAFLILLITCGIFGRGRKPNAAQLIEKKIEETAIKPPQDQEVCFSPEENCDAKLWKFIQSAQKNLDIAIFDITHPKIVHEIAVASKRIPVRVLVDKRQAKGPHSLVSTLIKAGVNVRVGYQRGIMHNKFTVVDSRMVETGSFNYTNHATNDNNENQVYLANPSIVDAFKKRFEMIWEEGRTDLAFQKEP